MILMSINIIISVFLAACFVGVNHALQPSRESFIDLLACRSTGRFGKCGGVCLIRNSKCGKIISSGEISCGCTYCNYNKTSNTCYDECQNRQLSQCIPEVNKPKTNNDCK